MRALLAVGLLVWTLVLIPTSAYGAANDCESWAGCVDASRGPAGTINASVKKVKSDTVPGRGAPGDYGEAPERTHWKTLEEYMAPACSGNGVNGPKNICAAAMTTCPGTDQVRWWVWHRVTEHVRNESGPPTSTVGEWIRRPGSYCLGPDDPGVPTIGQVIAQVQTGFRNLPLPTSAIQVDPAPATLVHIPTAFFAGGDQTATFAPVILGTRVTINARATSWTWTWGDGSAPQTFTTAGVPKRPVVSHVYDHSGDYPASVTVTWTGTFSIAGSTEVFEIRTPVEVESAPATVSVREARTELVDR